MTRNAYAATGAILVVVAAVSWLWFGRSALDRWSASGQPTVENDAAVGKDREPTLYCEFTEAADRLPRIGFYFLIESTRSPPAYTLIFQRKTDGLHAGSGGEDAPRPEWRFDGSASPAVLRAPDAATAIDLYDYDPSRHGIIWFEAGLRSNERKNIDGKCRRSAI